MSLLFYFLILVFSVFLALSSSSMMTLWVSMEISILSLMPILVKFKSSSTNESSLKYFLIQTSAGLIFLSAVLNSSDNVLLLSLFIKLGAFPFYFWVVHIYSGLSFFSIFILSTIQKFPPLIALSNTYNNFMIFFIIMTIITGSLGALYLTNFKKMLAFSSISHSGWMMSLSKMFYGWILYLMIYTLISFMLFYYLSLVYIKSLNQSIFMNNSLLSLTIWVMIMSIAGLPPFSGFLLKWMSFSILSEFWGALLWLMVILFSFSLFFYLSMFLVSTLTISSPFSVRLSFSKKSIFIILTNIFMFLFLMVLF